VDLYQLHALSKPEDIEQAFGPGGALEAFVEARQQGLTRFLGFSAHSAEVALEAMRRFSFDSVLFPINFVLYQEAAFGPQVVALAQEQGIGRLALKSMARTTWPEGLDRAARPFRKCWYEPITDPEEASLALRFTLSEPITAAIPPGEAALFRIAMDAGERFQPLTDAERVELQRRAAGLAPIFQRAA
jgi:predicted aldo/keto reductase-like oxidoreductase